MIPFMANFFDIMPTIFETIRFGTTFSPLKIYLFLANHIFQHRFFGTVFQSCLRMGFLLRVPGNCLFQFFRSWLRVVGGLKRVPRGKRMEVHNCKETLHWRKMCIVDFESELHRAHLKGPAIPLFLIFSVVSNLLCTNSQMKEFTLGIQSECQTLFHILPVAGRLEVSFLYPCLTV